MDDAAVGHIPLRPGQFVWRVLRGITVAQTGAACFAFCGIARPENFYAELRQAGIRLAGTRAFRDHHAYNEADVRALLQLRTESGAAALITTEKDAVNLGELMALLQPIHIVTVSMQLQPVGAADAGSPIGQLCAAIGHWNQTPVRK
jgi:tetraacyldisaccharide 4'-kinase